MRIKLSVLFLGMALLAGAAPFTGAAPVAGAASSEELAGFSYGSISVRPGAQEAVLTYRTLDAEQSWLCQIDGLECERDASPAPAAADGISGVILTPDMSKAVIRVPGFLALLDLKNNSVSSIVPRAADDRFFSFATLSPDGRFLAYFNPATQSQPTRHFRLVDFVQKKAYVFSEQVNYWDLLSEESVLFQFSPDSRFLIYKDDRHGPPTLYRVDLLNLAAGAGLSGSAFQGARLFSRDYSVSDFMLADSRTLLYLANREDPMRFDLYRYDLVTNDLRRIAVNASYHPPLRRAGDIVFFNRLTSWGSETVAYDISSGDIETLPRPEGDFEKIEPGTDLTLPNGTHGALLLPDSFSANQPHKLVIWLHGGPYRQAALGYHPYPSYGVYDWMLEGLREEGAIVLKLDYHGSYAHGRPFAESIKGSVGVKDVEDVLVAANALEDKYNISGTYLSGVSYGGYLALRSLVEQPRLFDGAVSINGVTDWLTLVNANPNTIFAADFNGPLTEENDNEAFYDRASVLGGIHGLTDQEVVLIHSRNDSTISFSQSSGFAKTLESAGKDARLVELEGQNHVLTSREAAATVCEEMFRAAGFKAGDYCGL